MTATPPLPPRQLFPIASQPGIKRDGTAFDSDFFSDGQWMRFNRGRPRKMGGYRLMNNGLLGPVRGMHLHTRNNFIDVHTGSAGAIQICAYDQNGNGAAIYDRSPAGFASNPANLWQLDEMYDSGGAVSLLIAHPGQNLTAIDQETDTTIYSGNISTTGALIALAGAPAVSGGICVAVPFLFAFGTNGYVAWCDTNAPTSWAAGSAGNARIARTKVVKGMVNRSGGGSSAPSVLLWSLDALIRASFVGGAAIFRFDTITDQSSVLSTQAIVEYDGLYFWPSKDRFLVYNGAVREVPNQMNLRWFFDGLNYAQRQKVFALKFPRWGEIWWLYPRGTATECTHAVIVNVRDNQWYDTALPADGRCAGYHSSVFQYPVMLSANLVGTETTYRQWMHEIGTDEVALGTSNAIRSYFTTAGMSFTTDGPMQQGWTGLDRQIVADRLEIDINQVGPMTLKVAGQSYPRDPVVSQSYTFQPGDTKIDLRDQRRVMTMTFESNVQGGDYEMGQCLAGLAPGDGRAN